MSKTSQFESKLKKQLKKILTISDLKNLGKEIFKDQYTDKKLYKMIYIMKTKGYLLSLKKDLFFVKNPDEDIQIESIEEILYWNLLKLHLKKYLRSNIRYIGGFKALQIHNYDFSIPDIIYISNFEKNSKEIILKGKYIYFKQYRENNQKLKTLIKKNITKEKIENLTFNIASLELALLESVYNPPEEEKNQILNLVKKTLKKKKKLLNFEIFENFIKLGKFNTSLNRLYFLSKSIDKNLAENFLKIIKKYGYLLTDIF